MGEFLLTLKDGSESATELDERGFHLVSSNQRRSVVRAQVKVENTGMAMALHLLA